MESIRKKQIQQEMSNLFNERDNARCQGDFQTVEQIECKLIELNIRLVWKFVYKVADKFAIDIVCSNEDLYQIGCIGLMRAVKGYDITRGAMFSTYASYWIESEIIKYIIDNPKGTIRVPKARTWLIRRVVAYHYKRQIELGRKLSYQELATELGMKVEDIIDILKDADVKITSLDQPLHSETELTLNDTIYDDTILAVEDIVTRDLQQKYNNQAISRTISLSQHVVLDLKLQFPNLTDQEIGQLLGVSRQRIFQIYTSAIAKLKKCSKIILDGSPTLSNQDDSYYNKRIHDITRYATARVNKNNKRTIMFTTTYVEASLNKAYLDNVLTKDEVNAILGKQYNPNVILADAYAKLFLFMIDPNDKELLQINYPHIPNDLFKYYNEQGISDEKVFEMISMLSQKDQENLCKYYGENYNQALVIYLVEDIKIISDIIIKLNINAKTQRLSRSKSNFS
ncbi:MAG: sigma-70 family RNA polymerase sigma factor [bacterium]|nr:sigma-70 family RNA polymerase sigma factor [bacterium]